MNIFILYDICEHKPCGVITTLHEKEKIEEIISKVKENDFYDSLDLEKALYDNDSSVEWICDSMCINW